MDNEMIVAFKQGTHSLQICGTVSLHELLFGSQQDVRFKPEDGEAELTL